MNELMQLIVNPTFLKLILAVFLYWVFNAAVDAMNPPKEGTNAFLAWGYRFLHKLAGNLSRGAKAIHVPGEE